MWLDVRIHGNYQCYRNGGILKDCFAASEEEGWADCHERDDNGNIIIERDPDNILEYGEPPHTRIKTHRYFGKIELIRTPIEKTA